ncbi:MAG: alpha/beta hydrolase [bacterium]
MTTPSLPKKYAELSCGRIAYLEVGGADKPPVLFVHGIPTSGYLWRHVLRFLQNDFHCYAPDLMGLGDTEVDVDRVPLHMDAQAEMLLELMDNLGHKEFFLVCHDQGGAAAQILVARQPQRVAAFVLTDCVCYDNWPVPVIAAYQRLLQIPGLIEWAGRAGLIQWLERSTPLSAFKNGVYQRDRMTAEAIREYLRPLEDRRSRERFKRFFLAGHPRYSLQAVEGLKRYDKPTLILWAAEDRYISPSWGKKLYEDIPGAEGFELIPFCGHFWQEERPAEFASRIGAFLARHAGTGNGNRKEA